MLCICSRGFYGAIFFHNNDAYDLGLYLSEAAFAFQTDVVAGAGDAQ